MPPGTGSSNNPFTGNATNNPQDVIMIDSDDNDGPSTTRQKPNVGGGKDTGRHSDFVASVAREKRLRSRFREVRHAAQCILMDRELLMIHALAAHDTIPQTRRRFLAQLIAPDDAAVAATLSADRFVIATGPSSAPDVPVPRTVIDVHEDGDAGWRRPEPSSSSKSTQGKGRILESGGVTTVIPFSGPHT